jgi:hypothetical protein
LGTAASRPTFSGSSRYRCRNPDVQELTDEAFLLPRDMGRGRPHRLADPNSDRLTLLTLVAGGERPILQRRKPLKPWNLTTGVQSAHSGGRLLWPIYPREQTLGEGATTVSTIARRKRGRKFATRVRPMLDCTSFG